jgi:hypothetical protein
MATQQCRAHRATGLLQELSLATKHLDSADEAVNDVADQLAGQSVLGSSKTMCSLDPGRTIFAGLDAFRSTP